MLLESEKIFGELEELGSREPRLDIEADSKERKNNVSEPIGKPCNLEDSYENEADEVDYEKYGCHRAELHAHVNYSKGKEGKLVCK